VILITAMMKKASILTTILFTVISQYAQSQLKAPGVKWDESYSFDMYNASKIEFYAKNNELMRTMQYRTYYQSDGENFDVKYITEQKFSAQETIIDKKYQVAIQIFGIVGGPNTTYNAGGYKMPAEADLKKLEIVPANETKLICGVACKKYTYTYLKIFGEVWITDLITLPNDIGMFRACKMAAKHNTLSVPGFVMEMTTEDAKGGKTLMTTVSLKNAEKYTVNLKGVNMSTAINKVNYYIF
jgi:hypothetical protein